MTITNVITAGDYKGYIDFKNAKKGLYIYGAFGLGKKTFINKDMCAGWRSYTRNINRFCMSSSGSMTPA